MFHEKSNLFPPRPARSGRQGVLPDLRAGACRGGRDRRPVSRLRALALDGPARRDSRRPGSRAARRKSPGREALTRRGDSLRGRNLRNVAPTRGRLSRKVKTDDIGA